VICLIREALDAIAAEWHENGRGAAFDDLRPFLDGHGDLAELARCRRQNEATLRSQIHRPRRAFWHQLKAKITPTVPSTQDIADELKTLLMALKQ